MRELQNCGKFLTTATILFSLTGCLVTRNEVREGKSEPLTAAQVLAIVDPFIV